MSLFGSLSRHKNLDELAEPRDFPSYQSAATRQAEARANLGLPTNAQLSKKLQTLDIADGSAEATYYLESQYDGTLADIRTIIDGAVSTADITVTVSINGVAVTGGVVTIATAASAAGDVDNAAPSAANALLVGDIISAVVTGGGAGGSPRVHLTYVITEIVS